MRRQLRPGSCSSFFSLLETHACTMRGASDAGVQCERHAVRVGVRRGCLTFAREGRIVRAKNTVSYGSTTQRETEVNCGKDVRRSALAFFSRRTPQTKRAAPKGCPL